MKQILALGVLCAAAGLASAAPVMSTSAGTYAGAQNVNGLFTLDLNPNIFDSTTIGHVEITQAGRPTAGFDYYAFSHLGGIVHLDMDGPANIDMEIGIWDVATGTLMADNDDNGVDPGSNSGLNAGIFNLNLAAGDYRVGVCAFNCFFSSNGVMTGNALFTGATYRFNISANNGTVPEPGSLALAGLALLGAGAARRRFAR